MFHLRGKNLKKEKESTKPRSTAKGAGGSAWGKKAEECRSPQPLSPPKAYDDGPSAAGHVPEKPSSALCPEECIFSQEMLSEMNSCASL